MQERLRVLRGTVRVDSAPSRGTRIDVWVPHETIAQDAAQESAGMGASRRLPATASPSMKRPRILLADDQC